MKCEITAKHSCFFQNSCYPLLALLVMVAIFGLAPQQLQAQMFSVGNTGPRFNTPQTEFYGGLEPLKVTYQVGSDFTDIHGRDSFHF